jgi:nicotinamidase-related amidase
MSSPRPFDAAATAVLLMDYQVGILAGLGAAADPLLQRANYATAAAHAAGLPVIYVKVCFRPGHPEVSPRNLMFAGHKESGRFASGAPETEIHPAIAPQRPDAVVMKRRVSAFAGSDLEVILRARAIETLVLLGVATSGVVLSTVRHAADADYRLIVLADGCADRDPEVHRVLMEKVFPRQAAVMTVDDFVAHLRGRPASPR